MTARINYSRRSGFTLVEMLVTMALITLIMSILSEAFVEGLETFRQLKAIGDMQENLRTAVVPLRNDLLQRHFDGTQKLSTGFGTGPGQPGGPVVNLRPSRGFFRIQHGTRPILEGFDGDGFPSSRSTDHILHMAVALVGTRRTDFQTADAPGVLSPANLAADPSRWLWSQGPPDYSQPAQLDPINNTLYSATNRGSMNGQWAEVMWFLQPMLDPKDGTQMYAGPSNTPLFTLSRRQRLLVTDNNDKLNQIDRIASTFFSLFPEIACVPDLVNLPNPMYFPSPSDLTDPTKRSMMITNAAGTFSQPQPMTGTARNADRVIADVISFEIRVLRPGSYRFEDLFEAMTALGIPFPADQNGNPLVPLAYDTATWPVDKLVLRAVQIIIRVWDEKTQQVRQMTMIQDM
jgi:prepilin-type N-terminal cleavage/methylation domain-containing protein